MNQLKIEKKIKNRLKGTVSVVNIVFYGKAFKNKLLFATARKFNLRINKDMPADILVQSNV